MTDAALRDRVRTGLQSALASSNDVDEYLSRVVRSTGELIGLHASFTLSTMLYDAPFTVATTDRDAWQADQIEFDTAEGPCYELLHSDGVIPGIDLRTERRWPAWSAVANLLGFRSAAAIAVEFVPGEKLVLNCYSVGEDLLDSSTVDVARTFLEEVAFTMPLALRIAQQAAALNQQAAEIAQLQEALASRATIDQALGVLMAQNRCTRDEAFGILRRASQNRNIKLRDIAGVIIERFTGHPPALPPTFQRALREQ